MKTIIRGGTLVLPSGRYEADVICDNGVIEAVERHQRPVNVDHEIDASECCVFPGFIDPHIHSRDPGLIAKEDFWHSTRAAAAGGVTTVFEMPNAIPPVTDRVVFETRASEHRAKAHVDFGLWAMSLGARNLDSLPELVDAGAVGVKLFWGYALNKATMQLVYNTADESPANLIPPPSNGDVFDVFRVVAEVGGLLAAHCEDRGVIAACEDRPIKSYGDFLASRPEVSEAAAVALGAEFARATGCRFHVVHLSSRRGVSIIRAAQRAGVTITAETCPQYLALSDASFEAVGPLMKVFPPIRDAKHQAALWEGITDGTIMSVGSDHAPHTLEEKARELATQPAGFPGLETMAPVLINAMAEGRLTLERLAWILSEGTARLFGIYPQKGTIQPGADADFTIVDPNGSTVIEQSKLQTKNPVSPWSNVTLRGRIRGTVLRGRMIMADNEVLGEPNGQLVRPGPSRVAVNRVRG